MSNAKVKGNRTSPGRTALVVSFGLHLLLFTVLGVLEFSRPSSQAVAGNVSLAQINRIVESSAIVPKPRVKPKTFTPSRQVSVSDIRIDTPLLLDSSSSVTPEIIPIKSKVGFLPDSIALPQVTEFFSSATERRKIAYVVDVSGSMHGMLGQVRNQLKQSIDSLKPDNYFYAVFFGGDKIIESGQGKLVRATTDAKKRAFSLIRSIKAGGRTNANQALIRAIHVMKNSDAAAGQIYFLTDGFDLQLGQSEEFCVSVENIRKSLAPELRISTIGFWMDDEDRQILARMAKESGGQFIHIE